jgi:hypothetical protein
VVGSPREGDWAIVDGVEGEEIGAGALSRERGGRGAIGGKVFGFKVSYGFGEGDREFGQAAQSGICDRRSIDDGGRLLIDNDVVADFSRDGRIEGIGGQFCVRDIVIGCPRHGH